jgi:hypothetical protein
VNNNRGDWRTRRHSPLEVRESDGDEGLLDAQQAGSLAQLERNRILARPVDIFAIRPDARQPRRVVPAVVRAEEYSHPGQLLNAWLWYAAYECDPDASVHERASVEPMFKAVIAGEEGARPETAGPILSALLAVADLAASIKRDGLTNPITVAGIDDGAYLIETGERRWLAYHLLHHLETPGDWLRIPARVVVFDVWRQASENNARADLNAIGRARQFAILLMDLLGARGETFAPFDAFYHEQDYYAQVADGERHRVPRGQSEKLLNALGLKNPQQLRQCRALLSLESQIWTAADDENWSQTNLIEYLKTGKKPRFEGYTVLVNTVWTENGAKTPMGEGEHATNVAPNISQMDAPPPPLVAGDQVVLQDGRHATFEGAVGTDAVKVRTARGTRVEKAARVTLVDVEADTEPAQGYISLVDMLGAVERLYAAMAGEVNGMAAADVELLRRFARDVEGRLKNGDFENLDLNQEIQKRGGGGHG